MAEARKWANVKFREPNGLLRTVAKFRHDGDAWQYARDLNLDTGRMTRAELRNGTSKDFTEPMTPIRTAVQV